MVRILNYKSSSGSMSKRWYQENKRDPWRRDAKSKGYRARSAYKLKQIQEKFGIIRKGDYVLDIGCHPGGWTQVAVEEAGGSGKVIGVDLLVTSPVEGATVLVGDITHDSTIEEIAREISGVALNCVISDISPRLTGRYDTDQAISWSSQRWHWMLHPTSWPRGRLRYEGLPRSRYRGPRWGC